MLTEYLVPDAADLAALLGVALLTVSPFVRKRPSILTVHSVIGAAFAAHFWLSGLTAAAIISSLGAVQALAATGAVRWPILDRIGYALIPVMAGAALWFWAGPVTLLAAVAMALITVGRMCRDVTRLRLFLLAGCTVWVVHDAAVGAWIMLAGDVLSWLTGFAMLFGQPILAKVQMAFARPQHA